MMPGFDLTQIIGVLSFGTAVIACAAAAWRSPPSEARMWGAISFVNGFFAVEVATRMRDQLLSLAHQMAAAHGVYQDRRLPQAIIIATLAIVFMVGAALFLVRMVSKTWSLRVASSTTIALVGLFAIEGVSLHAMDAVLWSQYYQVTSVGWLRLVGAGIIIFAAITRVASSASEEQRIEYR